MIEVRQIQTGDIAWAEDPESAIVAARTLCEDAWQTHAFQGAERSVSFYVDGALVRGNIPEAAIWAAGAAA